MYVDYKILEAISYWINAFKVKQVGERIPVIKYRFLILYIDIDS